MVRQMMLLVLLHCIFTPFMAVEELDRLPQGKLQYRPQLAALEAEKIMLLTAFGYGSECSSQEVR